MVNRIELEWSLPKCLPMQIHCKVGAQEKYQHLINLMSKNYNEETKKWEHKDVLPGVKMPKLKSKNQASSFNCSLPACSDCKQTPFCQSELPLLHALTVHSP